VIDNNKGKVDVVYNSSEEKTWKRVLLTNPKTQRVLNDL
jgi:hypothetical protein